MEAMVLKGFGGVENFILKNIPEPTLKKGEVLVCVKAIGINPIDIKTRQGSGMASQYKDDDNIVIGWDISGTVAKISDDVNCLAVGDEVFGTVNFPGKGGAYAEYVSAPADQLAKKPAGISHNQAVAATLSALTAWQALIATANIRNGQRVLIHGGAGGVGSYAIQIAKKRGCYIVTTAATADFDFVKSIGADEVIDYKNQKFEYIAKNMDFILDTVGGENFVRSLQVLKPDGMIVLLPSDKKQEADKAAKEHHVKNYRHILVHSSGEDMQQIAAMLQDKSMKVRVDKTFPFGQLPQAHTTLENGHIRGKIVVEL